MQEGADILGNALRDYLNGEEVLPIKVYSDIAEPDEGDVQTGIRRPGIQGAVIIQGRVTEVLDSARLIQTVVSDFFLDSPEKLQIA